LLHRVVAGPSPAMPVFGSAFFLMAPFFLMAV
jgi:hypothetical protein